MFVHQQYLELFITLNSTGPTPTSPEVSRQKKRTQPLSHAAEMAMPPLIHKVTGTSNVSMDAAHPSSTVAARSQVDTSTVNDRANCAKPPNNALTLNVQTSRVFLVP